MEKKDIDLSAVGTPLTKFDYPIDKRLTLATNRILQEAERSLDMFWLSIDQHFIKHAGKRLHDLLAGVLSERILKRTPDWVSSGVTGDSPDPPMKSRVLQLSCTNFNGRTDNAKEELKPSPASTKVKTRGTAVLQRPDPPDRQEQNLVTDQSARLPVSKRSLKVFSTLFHQQRGGNVPGELQWYDFLSAMTSVGFSVRKLDGSAWVFEPHMNALRRSIIFHEPHPSNKIPFTMARRYGRRLARAYGWTGDSFVHE